MAPRSAVCGVLLRVLFCVLFYGVFNVVVVGLGVWWLCVWCLCCVRGLVCVWCLGCVSLLCCVRCGVLCQVSDGCSVCVVCSWCGVCQVSDGG